MNTTFGPDPFAADRRQMVETQLRARGLRDERVLHALATVPRERFVPPDQRPYAYADSALLIGLGQTISQPYMVALMVELLEVAAHHRVLEVGAGSGYQAAVLGQLAAEVYGIEIVPELARRAEGVLAELGYGNVHIIAGDGTRGWPDAAPYDRIIIAAAAPDVPPPLLEQLAEGGRLVAPVGSRGHQDCRTYTKTNGKLRYHGGIGCVFVPLRGEHGWPDDAWPGV